MNQIGEVQGEVNETTLSVPEQMMHSVVRLELPSGGHGTGFFHHFYEHSGVSLPAIITNKHVIENERAIRFKLTMTTDDQLPIIGKTIDIRLQDLSKRTVIHPKSDLVAIVIGDVRSECIKRGTPVTILGCHNSLIPTRQEFRQLLPLEEVVTVGYPGQLWDHVNSLPVFHRGSTASAPYIDFCGKREFVVDFATWPGASGSPVFIYNEGSFVTRQGLSLASSRLCLIGVVYGVATQEVTGEVVIQKAPTSYKRTKLKAASDVPTNLGVCINSSRILELEQYLYTLGVSRPRGYASRSDL